MDRRCRRKGGANNGWYCPCIDSRSLSENGQMRCCQSCLTRCDRRIVEEQCATMNCFIVLMMVSRLFFSLQNQMSRPTNEAALLKWVVSSYLPTALLVKLLRPPILKCERFGRHRQSAGFAFKSKYLRVPASHCAHALLFPSTLLPPGAPN
jgi:hypothetical protein